MGSGGGRGHGGHDATEEDRMTKESRTIPIVPCPTTTPLPPHITQYDRSCMREFDGFLVTMVIRGLGFLRLDDYVINIGFYISTDLHVQAMLHAPLVCSSAFFSPKGIVT